MAERQANGRPGTDKGRGAGTLEAWVREPQGPRQGAVLVPYPVGWGRLLPFRLPTSRTLPTLPHHLCHSLLLLTPSPQC